jgi:hypothetical protein
VLLLQLAPLNLKLCSLSNLTHFLDCRGIEEESIDVRVGSAVRANSGSLPGSPSGSLSTAARLPPAACRWDSQATAEVERSLGTG